MEGAAEFSAEMTSGAVANYEQAGETKGHEKEIETEFAADEDSYDLSPKWLYNRSRRQVRHALCCAENRRDNGRTSR